MRLVILIHLFFSQSHCSQHQQFCKYCSAEKACRSKTVTCASCDGLSADQCKSCLLYYIICSSTLFLLTLSCSDPNCKFCEEYQECAELEYSCQKCTTTSAEKYCSTQYCHWCSTENACVSIF